MAGVDRHRVGPRPQDRAAGEQPAIRAVVTTTFRYDERSGIAVPLEMRERYTLANGNRVHMVATYGHFRRFDVSASEDIHTAAARPSSSRGPA